jgi:predicted ATPase
VGREAEIAEIEAALVESRLLTITGVGGTGKTRLAVTVGERLLPEFEGGVWLTELASVLEPNAVPHVVASAIGARQLPGKTIIESVVQSLELRSLLLILDNCEHVLDTVAELVSEVVEHCPGVRVLATSREGLAVRGERTLTLRSLSEEEGVELFRDRARAAEAVGELEPETLTRMTQRLDGIPLAIELAAARCRTMSLEEIEARLGDRFRLLRGSARGRTERHQTLRNTVAWSHDLLEALEQQVFNRLSVFAGGFTLDAAVQVVGGDDIDGLDVEDAVAALVERSMLIASPTGDGTWYRLLETLRQFGEERLVETGRSGLFQDRHLAWYVGFADRALVGQYSRNDEPWWRALGREFENLRTATYRAIRGC